MGEKSILSPPLPIRSLPEDSAQVSGCPTSFRTTEKDGQWPLSRLSFSEGSGRRAMGYGFSTRASMSQSAPGGERSFRLPRGAPFPAAAFFSKKKPPPPKKGGGG